MTCRSFCVCAFFLASFLLAPLWVSAQPATSYAITLVDPAAHLLQVKMVVPPGASVHRLQLPVWNALYQVRDFSQYVTALQAHSQSGQELSVRAVNKSCWQVAGTAQGAVIEYRF